MGVPIMELPIARTPLAATSIAGDIQRQDRLGRVFLKPPLAILGAESHLVARHGKLVLLAAIHAKLASGALGDDLVGRSVGRIRLGEHRRARRHPLRSAIHRDCRA